MFSNFSWFNRVTILNFLVTVILSILSSKFITNVPEEILPFWLESIVLGLLHVFIFLSLLPLLTKYLIQFDEEEINLSILFAFLIGFYLGRTSFISYPFYDDFGYLTIIGETLHFQIRFLFEPLNEHFAPLFRLLYMFVNNIFGINYIGIALVQAACLVLLIIPFLILMLRLGLTKVLVLVFSFILFSDHFLWKILPGKCFSLPVLIPCMGFILLLLYSWIWLAQGKINIRSIGVIITLLLVVSYTNSLITLPVVFLSTFIVLYLAAGDKVYFFKKYALLMFLGTATSVIYFIARSTLGEVPMPKSDLFTFNAYFSQIGRVFERYILNIPIKDLGVNEYWPKEVGIGLTAFLIIYGIVWLVSVYRKPETRSIDRLVFYTVSVEIFLVSFAQVILGRGEYWPIVERHAFLPFLGFYCALLFIADNIVRSIGIHELLSKPRVVTSSIRLFLVATVFSAMIFNKTLDLSDPRNVNANWNKFFKGLDRMLCAVEDPNWKGQKILPDLPLSDIPGNLGQTGPFIQSYHGYSLSFLARASQSFCYFSQNMKFVYPDLVPLHDWTWLCAKDKPASCKFYKKFFPDFYQSRINR